MTKNSFLTEVNFPKMGEGHQKYAYKGKVPKNMNYWVYFQQGWSYHTETR